MSTTFAKFFRAAMVMLLVALGGFYSTTSAAEITLDFTKTGLPDEISSSSKAPSTGTFSIGGYTVDLVNCSQATTKITTTQTIKTLVVAGNGNEGSITLHPSLNLTSIKFTLPEVQSKCLMTVTCGEETLVSSKKPNKDDNTFNIPSGTTTAGKAITFTFTAKTKISSVTFVTDGDTPITPTPDTPGTTDWVKFIKYNDNSDLTNITELPVGQVIKLESLVQGLMLNSAIGSDYVITYSIDGNDPTFSGGTGGSKNSPYWQDGKGKKNQNGYIYRRGIALSGKAGDQVTVKVKIFKVTYKADGTTYESSNEAWSTSKKFTLTEGTQPLPSDIKFSPDTRTSAISNAEKNYDYKDDDIEKLDITESCTATGINGNTIIAKYSTNTQYDIQQILNAANVSMDNTTAGVFSTEYKMRKTSAVQITPNGIISSDVARSYYWYIPARKDLTLELVPSYSNLSLSTDGIKKTTVTMTAYYMENGSRTYVNLKDIEPITIFSNDASIAKTDGKYTLAEDCLSATFEIEAVDNGTTKINVQTSKTSKINVKEYNDGKNDETAINYNPALADVTVKVIDGASMAPPTITPETSEYHVDFKSSVQADANYAAYYYVVKGKQANAPTPAEIQTKGEKIVKGQKIETDIEAGDDNIYNVYAVSYDDATNTLGNRIAQSTYTYVKIEKPVLTPGYEGEDKFYEFADDSLTIVASVATPGAQVYYTINSASEDVTKDNGTLYDGNKKIVIDRSSRIRAVAYKNGIYSEVVLYRYNKNTIDIDAPKFYQKEYVEGTEKTQINFKDLGSDKIVIRATYTDDTGDDEKTVAIDENSKKFSIYYTTDGSLPTPESYKYTGPFTVEGSVNKIIAYVLADGEGGDHSMSDRSILTLTNDNYHVWRTKRLAEGETPSPVAEKGNCNKYGVMLVDHALLYADNDAQTDLQVKAYFGGFASDADTRDNKHVWDHYTSKEVAKGTPIDGIGDFSVAPNIDARDEMGLLYDHSKANTKKAEYQTHKSTFRLPSMGAYTKFEPQMDGTLTIYCFQEGALYYRDAIGTKDCFNSRFIRKRPAYFVDEAGVSIKPINIETAGFLSKKWSELESNNFAGSDLEGEGKMQNGISQTLFTQKESLEIYNMFNDVIANHKNSNSTSQDIPLKDVVVYLNDGTHNKIPGYGLDNAKGTGTDNVVDGTGVCLPTASYVKYTFPVEAGKTYFFFGWMTKIGIRGFGFEPTTNKYNGELTIKTEKNETNADLTNGTKYSKVTVNRKFTKNTWTTLVLPFSVSDTIVKNVFGDQTQILHYRTIQGKTMYFYKHYHQMIVAGTPVIIKPSKEVNNPVFENVKIEAATVVDKPCNDYGYLKDGKEEEVNTTFNMIGSYNPQKVYNGNFYINTSGLVKKLNAQAGSSMLGGTRAYMYGTSDVQLTNMAKTAYDNETPVNMDDETTDIDFIEIDNNGQQVNGNIYNLNGQLVRKNATSLEGLAKGIYIVNGKKVSVD